MMERRQALDGSLPSARRARPPPARAARRRARSPSCAAGSGSQAVSTTMALHPPAAQPVPRRATFGPRVVPIIPDEARTFGMDSLFRELKIYAVAGPAVRAGRPRPAALATPSRKTARSSRRASPRPARWPASSPPAPATPPAACRWCRSSPSIRCSASSGSATSSGRRPTPGPAGFLLGATAGRTTLLGEGLQHQDGHSLVLASTVPPCQAYDPAFAYEVATIVQRRPRSACTATDARGRLLLPHPLQRELRDAGRCPSTSADDGIVARPLPLGRRARRASATRPRSCSPARPRAPPARPPTSWPSTTTSAPSCGRPRRYKRAARGGARRRALEPPAPDRGRRARRSSPSCSPTSTGPIVAVTDFMKIVPDQIARFVPGRAFVPLGTDGFGRSDTREALRRFFEIDARTSSSPCWRRWPRRATSSPRSSTDAIAALRHRPRRAPTRSGPDP